MSASNADKARGGSPTLAAPDIPEFMTAVQGKDYGAIDEMLMVEEGVKVPRLADLPAKKQASHIVIKTYAVALAPGDCRVLSGMTRELQGPPSFPYVPGGDCCGKVVEMPSGVDLPFELGDVVAARFSDGPRGALGEYAVVGSNICGKVPDNVSPEEAAALAGSTPSTLIADPIIEGERVLILGAGGGEGSHLCQHVRRKGASFVVGVSEDPDRLLKEPISCDRAINYKTEDVFDMEEFQKDPFDTVIDLAAGAWPRIVERAVQKKPLIVKTASQGGRFWTPTPDTPIFELHGIWAGLSLFLFPSLGRAVSSRMWSRWSLPKFTYTMAIPDTGDVMTRTLQLAKEGKLKAVVDAKGPFPFTTEGVRAAFKVQESRHPKGKVVVRVANKD
ncbi:furan-3-one reductase [Seminavis robusta]|uniref:Furan-3-one reductase n=1 Tax=Seminavis robusta TaxID=568900 RepID=A0A9N8HUL9_9STRA|nr:furan-3-one reductase [Seminavis robusta]|eukprot:Sro1401_g269510.1 furan-3-one reductase (389) ;mRNA; f:26310-27561